ncbi:metallophosphatase family protein [Salegentibacter sp. JZCK2]|uniref:metallophosphoesterase family protein n=1 Tax=Salegentibacter tibetensis TaxID=2873600 RepID=UPI001CCF2907|nr:metallophosphoesterase family protein [Salegentibacter tibetensis]MBZ9731551.1 metallophosphatase family protein [Salegentibacter tibetensis]
MDHKIKNIGTPEGRILIFGGVYSNLQALEKLKRIAEQEGIPASNCICTGDIVGYCAQPQETVDLFRKWNPHSIAGNVEIQLAEGKEDCGCDFKEGSRCDNFSQLWYPYAKSKLSKDATAWMKTLPDHLEFIYANKKFTVVHGAFDHVSEFIFKSTPWAKKEETFNATGSDVIIAGHCGIPFTHNLGGRSWINPGVIGMPANNGSPQVWYAILDAKQPGLVAHHSFKYHHKLASGLMRQNYLPEEYARTLRTGIWDNTEILPVNESRMRNLNFL